MFETLQKRTSEQQKERYKIVGVLLRLKFSQWDPSDRPRMVIASDAILSALEVNQVCQKM